VIPLLFLGMNFSIILKRLELKRAKNIFKKLVIKYNILFSLFCQQKNREALGFFI
jgi:hypothetical protein